MHSLLSINNKITAATILAWFALCTNAKPAWFPATLPKSNAKLELEFPYPFEVVLRTWENGPPDPQFLRSILMLSCPFQNPASLCDCREEVKETRSGNHVEKSKTIYTKNPFPYLIQKTVS